MVEPYKLNYPHQKITGTENCQRTPFDWHIMLYHHSTKDALKYNCMNKLHRFITERLSASLTYLRAQYLVQQ